MIHSNRAGLKNGIYLHVDALRKHILNNYVILVFKEINEFEQDCHIK